MKKIRKKFTREIGEKGKSLFFINIDIEMHISTVLDVQTGCRFIRTRTYRPRRVQRESKGKRQGYICPRKKEEEKIELGKTTSSR